MLSIVAFRLDFLGACWEGWSLESRGWFNIHLRHIWRVRVRPIREIAMIPATRLIGIRIWFIDQPRLKSLT